ncbi:TRAP transporter small permease [Bosea sp. TWI1241]|uniref:TRAP transporter small permease n=1 Tax=Bosea sp. TWI1241 TaxID=3148904 RepID=UPI003208EE24
MRALSKLNDLLAATIKIAVVVMVAVMLASLSGQVVMRYAFNVALSWSEELSLTLFCWVVLLSAALCVRENRHVRMTLLIERVPQALRPNAERGIYLLTALFGGYLAASGTTYFLETRGMTSSAIAYPIEYLYAAAPICGALIALFAIELAFAGTIPASEDDVDV